MLSALAILLLLLLLTQADVQFSLFQVCEAAEAEAPNLLQLTCGLPAPFTIKNGEKKPKNGSIFS